ncbi:MAG TPA: hypothetical protein VI959_05635 [Alphaproteobacteria bacterium]|nr:hypothetical protein [Alphaproteobacteria bacterium]
MKFLLAIASIFIVTNTFASEEDFHSMGAYAKNPEFLTILVKNINYDQSLEKEDVKQKAIKYSSESSYKIEISQEISKQIIEEQISSHFYDYAKYLRKSVNAPNNTKYPMDWTISILLGMYDYKQYMTQTLGEKGSDTLSTLLDNLSKPLLVALIEAGTKLSPNEIKKCPML